MRSFTNTLRSVFGPSAVARLRDLIAACEGRFAPCAATRKPIIAAVRAILFGRDERSIGLSFETDIDVAELSWLCC